MSDFFLEMKLMEHDSDQLAELQKQKNKLLQELFALQENLKGIIFRSHFILTVIIVINTYLGHITASKYIHLL